MSGDLSLTQSLGGLRIANPDDEDAVGSPTSPPPNRPAPPSSHSSNSTVTDSNRRPDLLPTLSHQSSDYGEGLGFHPDEYHLQTTQISPTVNQHPQPMPIQRLQQDSTGRTQLSHRSSMQLDYQGQQASQYPPNASGYSPQMRQGGPQAFDVRPVSGMYSQPNASASSGFSQGSYSYRSEMGSADSGGLARHGSAAGMRQGSGPIPIRDGSRIYRQPSQQMNGPLPPRRNSRRTRPPPGSNPVYDNPEASYAGNGQRPRNAEEWREKGAAVSTRQGVDSSGQPVQRMIKKGVKDFNFGRTLGEGSYSTVLAATDRQNLKEYAIKVLDKRHIIKEKKVKYVNIERDTLNRLTDHPGVVRLYYTFQDERSLYFVLDLASGGELLGVLKKLGSFDVECARFYAAEILDSIAYMHSKGVIHRDLKPENVLLDRDMHVKITDFGTAKILNNELKQNGSNTASNGDVPGDPTDGMDTDRAVSFVGTAEYVSPELLRDKNACKSSDLWAFGCILFQLIAGRPPFKAANEYLTFQKILGLEYAFPDGFPEIARDLVERLLVLEPANRLSVEHIRNHRFFEGTQWGKSLWRQKAPRLKAYVPPPAAPIKLGAGNGVPFGQISSGPPPASLQQAQTQTPASRPQLRGITELPPPSQLDIDWSPVLTHNNERILKLGNLIVNSSSQASSPGGKSADPVTPSEKPKFSRFFSGSTTKKKERLVLITSNARVILAPAGGNEKKIKMEIPLVSPGCSWKSYVDARGLTAWSIDTRDKHLTFEDPRATTSDPAGSKYSTQEWIDSVEQAREIALSQSASSSYAGEGILNGLNSGINSPADSLGGDSAMPMSGPSSNSNTGRQTLRKEKDDGDGNKGRKRFSKRHSKSGLAAVF